MLSEHRLIVVMPAYNASRTLERTVGEIPRPPVDLILLVDDESRDETVELARSLGLEVERHAENRGYGANQKTCYRLALEHGADLVVMLHPDYQYSPRLIEPMAALVACGEYDLVLGSRILGGGALTGGMPLYKYLSNRILTLVQNLLLGSKLSEFHTGYRAFSREVLETLPLERNSDGFLFDNQVLVQAHHAGFRIGEVSCPTRYSPEASSIGFGASCRYGVGVLATSVAYRLHRWRLRRSPLLS